MLLFNLTWEETDRLDRTMVVVVPFGSVEQHSFHLPLGTDSILAEEVARRLENRVPDRVMLAPSVWLGCSKHHMDFAGSLTAETDTFIRVGEEVVQSLAHHGFRNFILLNGHGGNTSKIAVLVEKLRYRPGPVLKVVGVTYWNLIGEEIKTIRETPLGGMGHSCELETSMMLACHPELVRCNRMEADGPSARSEFEEADMFAAGSVAVAKPFKEITRHGGFGDPTKASSAKGEQILEAVMAKLVKLVDEIRSGRV